MDETSNSGIFARLDYVFGGATFCPWTFLGLVCLFTCQVLAFGMGIPFFQDGVIDPYFVLVLLAACGALFLFMGLFRPLLRALISLPGLISAGVVSGLACVVIGNVDFIAPELPSALLETIYLVAAVFMGCSQAVLIMRAARHLCEMETLHVFCTLCLMVVVSGVILAGVTTNQILMVLAVCLLPLLAAGCLTQSKASANGAVDFYTGSKANEGTPAYSRGYRRLVIAFSVFFFAIGATRALKPADDFANSVDLGYLILVLLAIFGIVFFFVQHRPPTQNGGAARDEQAATMTEEADSFESSSSPRYRFGIFSSLKGMYVAAIVILVIAIIVPPLAQDVTFFNVLYYFDYVLLFIVFFVLVLFVAHMGEAPPRIIIGVALGSAICAMGIGFLAGYYFLQLVYENRMFINIILGCLVTLFCVTGFSLRDFPQLTTRGYGARKAQAAAQGDGAEGDEAALTDEVLDAIVNDYDLSEREGEVFRLLAQGYTAEYIGEQLFISLNTVRAHRRHIYEKLDIHSRDDLLGLAHNYLPKK